MNKEKERQVNQFMDSLSDIDGDLLMDVLPPAPVRQVKKHPALAWKRWSTIAAGLVFLVMIGFIIRLTGGLGMLSTKDLAPADLREDQEGYGNSLPQNFEPEVQAPPNLTTSSRGLAESVRAMMDLTDRVSADLLCGCGADNRAYSPAGFYQALQLLEEEEDREGFSLEAYQGQGMDLDYQASLEGENLLQKIRLAIRVQAIAETEVSPHGILFYQFPEASAYRKSGDGSLAARLPLEGGMLYVLLPDEGRTPDDLLAEESLFSNLIKLEGDGERVNLRMPALSVKTQADPETGETGGGQGRTFASLGQAIELDFIPLPPGEPAPDLTVIEVDRPFIYLLTDDDGIPLIAGVLRDPIRP